MTIVAGELEFPNNAIALIAARAKQVVDADLNVFKRPLRTSDPSQSLGIFPSLKAPDAGSIETQGVDLRVPTIARYNVILQAMAKSTNEEEAISIHSIFANRLYRMVLTDIPLHTGLTALSVVANNTQERMQKRGVQVQRYLSNEVQGSFVQTNWIEFWFETETVRIA